MKLLQNYMKRRPCVYLIVLSIIFSVTTLSCQKKADINKLFNETEKRLELNFEYVRTAEGSFSGIGDGESYHVDYDKINQLVHVFSSRLAYIHIDEIYFVNINKFQCTDTQLCFQNDDVRVIIENADNYYIVHIYKKSCRGFSSSWNRYATFFNSKSKPLNLNEGLENVPEYEDRADTEMQGEYRDDNASSNQSSEDFYDPDEIERKAQNFLNKYKKESRYQAVLGYPIDTEVVKLFPVSIESQPDHSKVFKISFSGYDYENKKEELGITEDLPIAGLYVAYEGELYDCFDLEKDRNGTVYYTCRPHEIWTDI